MTHYVFSMLLLAIPVLIVSTYFLFISKMKNDKNKKLSEYTIFAISLIAVVIGIAFLIVGLPADSNYEKKPSILVLVVSSLAIIGEFFSLLHKKKRGTRPNNFVSGFMMIYAFTMVLWYSLYTIIVQ